MSVLELEDFTATQLLDVVCLFPGAVNVRCSKWFPQEQLTTLLLFLLLTDSVLGERLSHFTQ